MVGFCFVSFHRCDDGDGDADGDLVNSSTKFNARLVGVPHFHSNTKFSTIFTVGLLIRVAHFIKKVNIVFDIIIKDVLTGFKVTIFHLTNLFK